VIILSWQLTLLKQDSILKLRDEVVMTKDLRDLVTNLKEQLEALNKNILKSPQYILKDTKFNIDRKEKYERLAEYDRILSTKPTFKNDKLNDKLNEKFIEERGKGIDKKKFVIYTQRNIKSNPKFIEGVSPSKIIYRVGIFPNNNEDTNELFSTEEKAQKYIDDEKNKITTNNKQVRETLLDIRRKIDKNKIKITDKEIKEAKRKRNRLFNSLNAASKKEYSKEVTERLRKPPKDMNPKLKPSLDNLDTVRELKTTEDQQKEAQEKYTELESRKENYETELEDDENSERVKATVQRNLSKVKEEMKALKKIIEEGGTFSDANWNARFKEQGEETQFAGGKDDLRDEKGNVKDSSREWEEQTLASSKNKTKITTESKNSRLGKIIVVLDTIIKIPNGSKVDEKLLSTVNQVKYLFNEIVADNTIEDRMGITATLNEIFEGNYKADKIENHKVGLNDLLSSRRSTGKPKSEIKAITGNTLDKFSSMAEDIKNIVTKTKRNKRWPHDEIKMLLGGGSNNTKTILKEIDTPSAFSYQWNKAGKRFNPISLNANADKEKEVLDTKDRYMTKDWTYYDKLNTSIDKIRKLVATKVLGERTFLDYLKETQPVKGVSLRQRAKARREGLGNKSVISHLRRLLDRIFLPIPNGEGMGSFTNDTYDFSKKDYFASLLNRHLKFTNQTMESKQPITNNMMDKINVELKEANVVFNKIIDESLKENKLKKTESKELNIDGLSNKIKLIQDKKRLVNTIMENGFDEKQYAIIEEEEDNEDVVEEYELDSTLFANRKFDNKG
tara:strand:- start:718 stop:3081 length:2364 start_codon:yes stop_codon:yes gene_type:complete